MAVIGVLIELRPTTDDHLTAVFARIDAIAELGKGTLTYSLYFTGLESNITSNEIIRALLQRRLSESMSLIISSYQCILTF